MGWEGVNGVYKMKLLIRFGITIKSGKGFNGQVFLNVKCSHLKLVCIVCKIKITVKVFGVCKGK